MFQPFKKLPVAGIRRPSLEECFSEIYDHERAKRILMDACLSRDPVSILLHGPPQSAKTLFLEAIARYFDFFGGRPVTLDRATPAGLAELFAQRYRVYVFDEIDKAKTETLRVFNEAVESRRVSFVKHGQAVVIELPKDSKFFVGCNSVSALREKVPEVVTRFLDIPLPPMTYDMFREIVWLQLSRRGYNRQQSDLISKYAWAYGLRDVRKVRELGKIYPDGRVREIIEFIKYRREAIERLKSEMGRSRGRWL
jgi:hypothetical protein